MSIISKSPNNNDRYIDQSFWKQLYWKMLKLSNIKFNLRDFDVVETSTGIFISKNTGIASTPTPTHKKLWDLELTNVASNVATANVVSDVIQVYDYNQTQYAIRFLGNNYSYDLELSDGWTRDTDNGSYLHNVSNTATESYPAQDYVFIELDRANVTATICASDYFPDGDDSTEIIPLWIVGSTYSETINTTSNVVTAVYTIDIDNTVDMRDTITLNGMA
jgi:hypothetical protein